MSSFPLTPRDDSQEPKKRLVPAALTFAVDATFGLLGFAVTLRARDELPVPFSHLPTPVPPVMKVCGALPVLVLPSPPPPPPIPTEEEHE